MTNFLENMKFPEDLKYLNERELEGLAEEIRMFLVESVSKTGGHLSSNLGVVDLTLSLFRCFDIEKDKFIWDVGHQSYVHKILTGRKDDFENLRTKDGISGFPKRNESKYDAFDTGHSSTSISAALGMARARDLKGEDYKVIAVIGDGALTGGMAFEALNDAGFKKTNLTIILNDNQMSIAKNVGGLAKYLNNIRLEPGYNKMKTDITATLNQSNLGKSMANSLTKIKDSIKQLVVPSMLFEDMGIKYLGPIDGHNIILMNEVLRKAKDIKGPVIIHVITKKGKGYELAEDSPGKFHGISPFNLKTGKVSGLGGDNYSKVLGKSLIEIADKNENIVAVTAAMLDGTGLCEFSKKFPKRFFDVGIAEEHAVTLSAGMACAGLRPVFVVYSTFLQRAFDQVLHDVCIQKLPVVFCIDRAGVVGADGETHQGIMDISYLSVIPNMTIVAPKCLSELTLLLNWAVQYDGPVAIRYPRGGDMIETLEPMKDISYGKWEVLSEGVDIAIIATGKMLQYAVLAEEILKEKGIKPKIINATFIKPLDDELLGNLVKENFKIVTVEDNIKHGGFGTLVLESIVAKGFKESISILAYDDKFITQGNVSDIYSENGLDEIGISNAVFKLMNKEQV